MTAAAPYDPSAYERFTVTVHLAVLTVRAAALRAVVRR